MTEDEMVGWHRRLHGHGFGWIPGVDDRQGGLVCCSSWGRRVRHDRATELNCISDSFVDYNGYSISSKGFLPTVVNIMALHGMALSFIELDKAVVHVIRLVTFL